MAENKPNSGALFPNQYKNADTHPDLTGPFTGPNGEELQIAAWQNQSDNGKKYLSVSVTKKKPKETAQEEDDLLF